MLRYQKALLWLKNVLKSVAPRRLVALGVQSKPVRTGLLLLFLTFLAAGNVVHQIKGDARLCVALNLNGARSLLRIDRPKPLQIRAKIRPNPNDSKRSGR